MNRILISFAVLTLASASAETATTAAPSTEAKPEAASVGDSILRVNITAQNYNFYQPWEKGKPGTRRGLGVLLDNGQVLVSAQMVSDATYVELEQPKTGEKVPGKISVVDYEANLALIEISQEKPEFLEEVTRLTLDTSPNVGDELDEIGRAHV